MQICSKCQTQLIDTEEFCTNCGADQKNWSNRSLSLKKLQNNSRVSYIRVAVSYDCCPACRQVEGAYAKESIPHLPTEGCSHSLGCRCYYQPVLEEIYP